MAKVSPYKSHAAVRQILRVSISNVSFYVQLTGVSSLFRIRIRRDPLLFPRSGSSSTVIYDILVLLKTTQIFSTSVGFLKNPGLKEGSESRSQYSKFEIQGSGFA
jgi:hypothetical protein